MFVKILGIFDGIAALLILFAPIVPKVVMLYGAAYLILKGGAFAFMGNLISFLDVLCGVFMLALAFGAHSTFFTVAAIIFLVQKCVVGFL